MARAAILKRDLCIRRMTNLFDAAGSASENEESKLMLISCYPDLEVLVRDFENAHLKIIMETNSDFAKEDEVRDGFDKMRYKIKATYHKFAQQSVAVASSSNAQSSASRVRLPKISLPQFSGDLALWPSFFALYNTSIHGNAQITDMEKYQYLLASLSGDALNVIKNLPLSAEHYATAYDALVQRYQNKRKLATHYWQSIVAAKPLKSESAESLRTLLDNFSENLRALKLMDFPVDAWDFILLNTLLDKLTPALREKFEAEYRRSEIPHFPQLTEFLGDYCRVLASVSSSVLKPNDRSNKGNSSSKSSISTFVANSASCSVCGEAHYIGKCSTFLKLSEKDRYSKARQLQLCLSCLKMGHRSIACPSAARCRQCSAKHHTLLHFTSESAAGVEPSSGSPGTDLTNSAQKNESSVVSMTSISHVSSVVLLSTVQAEIADAQGNFFPVRILLDSASQSNFVTENCVQRGKLRRVPCNMTVRGLGDAKTTSTKGRTSLIIRATGRDDIRLSVDATVLPRISSQLPHHRVEFKAWPHIRGLSLADPEFYQPGAIDILLGAENFVSLLREGHRRGRMGEPDALNTIFGWVLMGAVAIPTTAPVRSFVSRLDTLDASIRQFWEVESVPVDNSTSNEDQRCEESFKKSTRRDFQGRFVVSYPFASESPCFVDSRQIAVSRFRSLERRLRADSDFGQQYHAFMRDYLNSGHMEFITQPAPVDGAVYYLPHHGVVKSESETTKLRVVFDASSRCTNGLSLNQTLLSGPKLQQDIVSILIKFRLGAVAVTADVRQMFRQIWIEPSQRNYQRIVWRFSESEPISDFQLNTVTFGITPSPYLAIRCLLQLAEEGKDSHPLAAAALQSSLYVDDVVASVSSEEEARDLRDQLCSLLGGAGFELRKWASSHLSVLNDMDINHCSNSMLSFDSKGDHYLKVLGLRWSARTDCFGFQVETLERHCTKRVILSELARIFDPLGFLAPLTFAAKLLIQRLWTLGLDWDEQPPLEICTQWSRYQAELKALGSCRISRSLSYSNCSKTELHGFCDASERGYGAVVYLRVVTPVEVHVRLLIAKSKVAPLKSLSLPRLELCAALLLSNLFSYLAQTLTDVLALDGKYAWSDSTVALAWIRSSPHKLETFVRNRVARIQDNTATVSWGHVGTEANPADHCSRGLFPKELVECRLWWAGPSWLKDFEPSSNLCSLLSDSMETEVSSTATLLSLDSPHRIVALLERFSSLNKILRIVAYCIRFVRKSQRKPIPGTLAIDQLESHAALLELVKMVQSESFALELSNLPEQKKLRKEVRKLVPFVDSHGILRVGGRIANADIAYEARHPALLPSKHRLTELVIERVHRENLHPGRRALQYLITQHFWIVGVQRAIKRTLSRCYRCLRAHPRLTQPFMADLPPQRVVPSKPFIISGVDFAGPFAITPCRKRGSKSFKAYVCVFVCFAVKAVHLELVFSLSTDAFVSALRRFISRRGRCAQLYSDCGTNFVGAARELARYIEQASEKEQIKWSFNPPSAPHFGGLWEAGVKAFKTHLARVVGDQILSMEEFSTVLAQIEAVLNSRPLCPLSTDPNDLTVLTPGHFLTTEALVALPNPDLSSIPINRLDRWQLLQRIHQDFWKRWSLEYLQTLQQRPKWLSNRNPVRAGDLVLIKEANSPPLRWKLGRITELYSGRDAIARVATVRTAEGTLTRPLVKLCPLPMGDTPVGPP